MPTSARSGAGMCNRPMISCTACAGFRTASSTEGVVSNQGTHMNQTLTRAQTLFLALVRAEDDLEQAKLMVASGTLGSGGLAQFEARIAAIKAL